MIDYNPKDWFTFIFRIHKAETFRKLVPMLIAICVYSWLVAFLETEIWKLAENSHVKNISLLHSLLGFVISLLLAFRSNTAYDRWWEGRKLWGQLVNNSRNLSIKMAALLPADDLRNRLFFRTMIPNFAFALKNHLQGKIIADEFVPNDDVQFGDLDTEKHIPNQIAARIVRKITELHRQGQISGEQLITLNAEMNSFTDICGACERIRSTPIPFSYSVFLKKFIFFYVMSLPFGFVFSLGYLVVPIVAFVFYVLASLELIAEEIENPFGNDANDLPMDRLSSNIRLHVSELI